MLVKPPSKATSEFLTDRLEHQSLDEHKIGLGNASMNNNPESSPQNNKRRVDPDVTTDDIPQDPNTKRRRSRHGSSEGLSHMNDRDRSVSLEVLDPLSDLTNTFHDDDDGFNHPPSGLLRDLETRAITVSQLIQEVKGIYAGLGMCSFGGPSV